MTFGIRDILWLFIVVTLLISWRISYDRQLSELDKLLLRIETIEIRNNALETLWADAQEIERAIRERPLVDKLEPQSDYLRRDLPPIAKEVDDAIERYKQRNSSSLSQ